jgi:hypothetical protein
MPPKILLCYAEGDPTGKWEAICLDYDIAIEGHSLDSVIGDLRAAVHEYIEYAQSLPAKERRRLLNRRVPLLQRFRFFYWAVMALLFGAGRTDLQRHEFTLPCAA